MEQKKRILITILCFALIFVLGGEVFFSAFSVKAEAAVEADSVVTDDLRKDASFDVKDFPANVEDFSLQVIQIAESESGRLFVYVYRPSAKTKDLKAKYINMALCEVTEQKPDFSLYTLRFINSDGVFEKYEVENFTVSKETVRHYNIVSILRPFDEDFDDPAKATDDTKEAVAFPVGKCWSAGYYNDTLIYNCEQSKVVDVEILSVGSIRYNNGYVLFNNSCDAHFVAFSISNFEVEHIYNAKIRYDLYSFSHSYYFDQVFPEEPVEIEVKNVEIKLTDYETGFNQGGGLFGYKYEWQRILTIDEFENQLSEFKNEGISFLTDEYKENLGSAQFVFQFLETDYLLTSNTYEYTNEFSKVSAVGVLQLHFVDTSGKVYNLGVVSDLVSDDGIPDFEVTIEDNIENKIEDLSALLKVLFYLILIILLIVVYFNFVHPLLKRAWRGFCDFLGILFLPIKFLFKKINRKK